MAAYPVTRLTPVPTEYALRRKSSNAAQNTPTITKDRSLVMLNFHFKGYLKTILNRRIPVEEFENKLARQLKVENVTATGSATLSLYLILKNIKKSKNDEVILSGYNYYDLVNVIKYCGMKPVFVEINEKTLLMNANEIGKKINKNTRAILVTHLFGFYNEVNRIKKLANKEIIIIEEEDRKCIDY